ncbi:MAG TPA: dienelactone hydrolase family protein [Planctomycetota bacterium]|nr:dienelactone hydrolase family protein [Planctomycetota bacterium]HRR82059.1 dienelactone hydrolase family protein [Planctomycetota bacterium]HRT94518.1 dienelactone hydrolase family protein [Planctomycetota bacterium]
MRTSRRRFLASATALAAFPGCYWSGTMKRRPIVPWLSEVQAAPADLPADTPRLAPLLVDAHGRPITTLGAWRTRRAELRQAWLDFLGTVRAERARPKLEVLEEDRPEGCIRQLVRYESEPGIPVEAYLLKPARQTGPRPGIVALHSTTNATIRQTAGLTDTPEKAFGLGLAQRGFVAFCPKCFLWVGEGDYLARVAAFHQRHPGAKGMAKMLFDAARALDVLETLPEVDAARLGAVGHSLGGKEALYLAAFDERVKAAVSSEGGIGISFSNWDAPWYLGQEVRDPGFARSHHELVGLIAPRAFLLLGGDDADGTRSWPYIEAALPVYRLYGGPARVGLFNHRKGHSVPPEAEERVREWFAACL